MSTTTEARARGLAAAAAAALKAQRSHTNWTENMVLELATVVDALPADATFTIEDLRALCSPTPPGTDARAWGHVTQAALRLGVIEPTGKHARAASSNGSPKPLYARGKLA
jgi:hypothetical protein